MGQKKQTSHFNMEMIAPEAMQLIYLQFSRDTIHLPHHFDRNNLGRIEKY